MSFFIDRLVTRNLRFCQGWQILTVLAILATSVFPSNTASPLSKVTAGILDDPATLREVSSSSIEVERKENQNANQMRQELPASPAELLKPDKFLFYTYNDQGNMITKQMSLHEIQTLIAGGNGGHVAMEMYEPQKSGDILNGEKKVMDVVEKVQNVLKSALDKPSTLAGSLSSIPEYANAEWSSILPVILTNGEVEPSSTSVEPNYVEIVRPDSSTNIQNESLSPSTEETQSSTLETSINTTTTEHFDNEPVSTVSSFVTTSSINNFSMTSIYSETQSSDKYTEKPMIPVAVITTEGQPFGDLQEVIENSVYQTSTKPTVEFINITDHLGMKGTSNATIFEEVPVKVWVESERNVTSHEPSVERVTEYVPILTMSFEPTVNDSSALTTDEVVSSTESETTKQLETESQETSTVQTSMLIDPTEKMTTVKALTENTITEIITPVIKTHPQTELSDHLFNNNVTTLAFEEKNVTMAEILETTTPQVALVASVSPMASAFIETEIMKDEKFHISHSPNLRYTTQAITSSTPASTLFDDNLTILSSVSLSDDTTKQASSITMDLPETTDLAINIAMTKNYTFKPFQPNVESLDNITPSSDTIRPIESIESMINTLEPLKVNSTEDSVVEESTSSSKIYDTSILQPVDANDITKSVSTPIYLPETTFIRINSPTDTPGSLLDKLPESTVTKATPIFNTSNIISSIITELNNHTSNIETTSVISEVTNDTLKEEILKEITTTPPVLTTNVTETYTNDVEEFIKNVSSPSAGQNTMMTTPVVSDELVTAINLIKSSSTGMTIAEVQDVTISSQIETSATSVINDSIQILDKVTNVTNKESSFVRHQNDGSEMNTSTTLQPLKEENMSDTTTLNSTKESQGAASTLSIEAETVQEMATTLIINEEFVTEPSLKVHDYILKNRTNIELETSLQANESRYTDSTEDTSTQMSSTPYIKLNVMFANDLPSSTSVPILFDNNTTATRTELPLESVLPSTTEKLIQHLSVQSNRTTVESAEKITTVSESNQTEPITANGSYTDIKSNKMNGTSQKEEMENKTKIQMANNDSISPPSRVIEEMLQSSASAVPMVTESSINWQLSSKSTYNILGNENYTVDTKTTDKWMLIPHKTATSMTKEVTMGPTTQKTTQDLTEKNQSPMLIPHLPTVSSEIKQSERIPLDSPQSVNALDVSVTKTESDVVNFSKMCNNLAFEFWLAANKGLSTSRSLVLSPFGMTSLLAMVFLGARGTTSDQMNELLKLDDVATFNPHLVFQNVTDMVGLTRGQGITNAAFVRELFVDRAKVRKTLPFYKEQAQQFYEGLVAEVNFATIGDIVRRRTNLMIRKQTGGRIKDFIKANTVPLRSPLAAVSANVFQTNCNSSFVSSDGRDGELYFAVSPAIRQRKLIPVPAIVWRSNILAGYEPSLDATAVALGKVESLVTTVFVLPGQQGHVAPGDSLDHLERRLIASASRDSNWNRLLKVLLPRNSLELQIPKFTHRSVVNATAALKRMGFERLFTEQADLKGINGIGNHLHLSDILQINLFGTCGDENPTNGRHHMETYPATPVRRARQRTQVPENSDMMFAIHRGPNILDYPETSAPKIDEAILVNGKADKRKKRHVEDSKVMIRSERPRLKLDRPFLYFVRHNPTGLILHMGRFNPRLLP